MSLFRHRRRGSVGIEAIMAFPVMLVLFGAVSQVMITAQSRVHLEQAAYAAARSALAFKCPDASVVQQLVSSVEWLQTDDCSIRRSQLDAEAQRRAEDAARWALVAAAPTNGDAAARGCPTVPAAKEILTGGDRILGRDQAAVNAICYVFEPGNVEVDLNWEHTGLSQWTGAINLPITATVTFRYPLSTPFRRFIRDGERGDGTYFKMGEATVTLR